MTRKAALYFILLNRGVRRVLLKNANSLKYKFSPLYFEKLENKQRRPTLLWKYLSHGNFIVSSA